MDITRTLTKHIAAIHNSASLNTTQRKVMNLFLENALKDGFDSKIHKIPLVKLTKDLGWSLNSNVTDLLKEDLKSLAKIQIEWNVLNKDKKNKWLAMQLLAEVGLENGEISYAYPPTLKDLLFNPNIYAKLNLETQKVLSTRYSVALWEVISGEFSIKQKNEVYTSWIDYEKILKLFGLSNSVYEKRYSDFLRKVLNPAIDDINQKSEFTVEAKLNREGRKLSQICFKAVKKDEEKAVLEIPADIDVKTEELKSRLDLHGFSKRFVNSIIKQYAYDEIDKALEIYNTQKSLEKIKYPTSFIKKALEEGWSLPSNEDKDTLEDVNPDYHALTQQINSIPESDECRTIRLKLLDDIGEGPYKSWIHPCNMSYFDRILTINSPTQFTKDWLESRLNHNIQGVVQKVIKDSEVQVKYELSKQLVGA